jgi:hypothetical protein
MWLLLVIKGLVLAAEILVAIPTLYLAADVTSQRRFAVVVQCIPTTEEHHD